MARVSRSPDDVPAPLPMRPRAAVALGRAIAGASRRARMGSGSVIGGRASLLLDRHLLSKLTLGKQVVLVSGTNGKTTTTHLLAAAAGPGVATNTEGANMGPGLVAALGTARDARRAILEVDERWLPGVLAEVGPAVVTLLNLSRDQLDRTQEVRAVASLWRRMLEEQPVAGVVANADDPLVAWAAGGAPDGVPVTWVGAGALWRLDAAGCPACGGRITFTSDDDGSVSWLCGRCGLRRPEPDIWVSDGCLASAEGSLTPLELALPGRANRANAAMAAAAAGQLGVELGAAVEAMGRVGDVAGRYRTARLAGCELHMLLAKNPAGWSEALEMVTASGRPVITAINARIADGRDPSWLWDVPFEALRGRFVVATGERRHDLAVRLAYAEVEHVIAPNLTEAAAAAGSEEVEVVANYTAFQDYRRELGI